MQRFSLPAERKLPPMANADSIEIEQRRQHLELQENVSWWGLSLLDLPDGSDQAKVRAWMESGHPERIRTKDSRLAIWERLKTKANRLAENKPLKFWRDDAANHPDAPTTAKLRHAALRSERAFVQICNIHDNNNVTFDMADFHVHTVRAIRQHEVSAIFLPLEHGKQIAANTPVCTPGGYRNHGDLRVGDMVYGPDGLPTPVIALSPETMATMRVTFSDGESIDCHPNHEWRVWNRGRQRYEIRETKHLAKRKYRSGKRSLYQVDYTEPLELPEADLPMDPFSLGVWLGNGSAGKGVVTHDVDDAYDMPFPPLSAWRGKDGRNVSTSYRSLTTALRATGVLLDKHIPDAYLWASRQQRWDLLCGLMDTDGSVDDRGRCRFVNTNMRLIEGVEHLLRSFGIRTRRLVAEPALSTSSIQGKRTIYTVAFSPDVFPFRMERKLRKCKVSPLKHKRRGIVSVEEIEPTPGRCIQVGRQDGMYLVGKTMIPTHNSALSSLLVPLMDWAEWSESSSCRVYWNQSNLTRWISLLMEYVEYSDEIHQVFPWIRRPTTDDRARHWSTEGFSIGGRQSADRSFEVLTARGHSTGNRYSRTGCDDWANSGNASSITVQDGLEEYLLSGPMTFGAYTPRESLYGTKWGTMFYLGTFFDRRDVGYRFYHWCIANGYQALKYDVYPLGALNPDQVLWQKGRPPEYIEKKKLQLRKMFNKRMRNIVIDEGTDTFLEEDVQAACQVSLKAGDQFRFGQVPAGAHAMIGFDPAAGSLKARAADPAICVYAQVHDADDAGMETGSFTAHFVEWERLTGYDFTKQCQTIVNWAQRLLLPVVIEKNTLQSAYKEYITKLAPDVKVYDHQTGCVDEDTMALTPEGWAHEETLKAGDLIYAVDPASGTGSWKPILNMTRYQHAGPAYRFYHRNMRVTTSPDHRWLVEWVGNKGKWRGRRISTSEGLKINELIPLGAPLATEPRQTISDDLVELVGWFVAEGWFRKRKGDNVSIAIAQSPSANPHKCAQIEALLNRLGAKWNKANNGMGVNVYIVTGETFGAINKLVPRKSLEVELVRRLNRRQRALLWDTMLLGDGSQGKKDGGTLATDEQSAEAITMLLALNGWAFSVATRNTPTNFNRNKPTILIHRKFKLRSAGRPKVIDYTGLLWCPTVKGGAWLAINDGRPFVTGNSEKWDPDDGVETFSPLFANKRAVIHAHKAPADELKALCEQLTEWPQGTRKDLLMAFWFARSKMRKRQQLTGRPRVLSDLPDYLNGLDYYWNTSTA